MVDEVFAASRLSLRTSETVSGVPSTHTPYLFPFHQKPSDPMSLSWFLRFVTPTPQNVTVTYNTSHHTHYTHRHIIRPKEYNGRVDPFYKGTFYKNRKKSAGDTQRTTTTTTITLYPQTSSSNHGGVRVMLKLPSDCERLVPSWREFQIL